MLTDPVTPAAGSGTTPDERFRKSDRLRKRWEFLAVQRKGRKVHLADVLAFVLPSRHGDQGRRLGVTVSKKVGKAAERNRVKRLMREVWRRKKSTLPLGYDIVLVAKNTASRLSYPGLERQLEHLAHKIRHVGRKRDS